MKCRPTGRLNHQLKPTKHRKELRPDWAPWSVDRFLKLVDAQVLDQQRFCRAIEGFVLDRNYGPCAGATTEDPQSQLYNELPWAKPKELDAAAGGKQQKNQAGTICFGLEDDGTTKTEVFVNLVDNSERLDSLGFWPFGQVGSRSWRFGVKKGWKNRIVLNFYPTSSLILEASGAHHNHT